VRYLHRASRLLLERGERERAFGYFERALLVDPSSAMIHYRIATMAASMGLPQQQIRHLRAALAFEPTRPTLRALLAWVLATCPEAGLRDPLEAVRLAEPLVQESGRDDPELLDVLAAALAAAGRYDEAVLAAAEARDLAVRRGDQALAGALAERLALYRDGHPWLEAKSGSG
jgi:tetratricopeptide (TPR) repeat protein